MALKDLLNINLIKIPLESDNKEDVLQELVNLVLKAKIIKDGDGVYNALLDREDLSSTGLSDGIAIPHAKTEEVENITMALGISPNGIDFDALDGNPSTVFFLLLARPEQSGQHMQALSEISMKVTDPSFIDNLLNSNSAQDVYKLLS